ncbi:porin [Azohydromonas caseinilytica]|uniref:Porin n=1 Tax=Azohydromonas caseinilytica TaxID=2728836 RepID=A0A848F3M0_9BURK|nr:porin [Azohydromonas caseinilytica]NML14677.1 porin [Azohydromonas caseinilytica]
MKRSLIAVAAVLAAGTAFAQSSVQVYGRVNTSVERLKDGDATSTQMVNNSSRWGLRGTEDLGSGLKALFLLESGFNSDDGRQTQTGAIFGRESWVGVEGNFGRVRLGNMGATAAYYATADYISLHNHDTGTSSDALYLGSGFKQNTISYNTPSFGGLVVEAQFGLKEAGAKNTAQVVANYDRGPLHLGASYLDGTAPDFVTDAIGGTPGLSVEAKQLGLRALYELGPVTVGAYYIRDKFDVEVAGAGSGDVKRDSYRVAAMYTFGGSELHANVGYANKLKVNGVKQDDTSALQYTLAYNYNLSKRTKVYAFYTRINNKDNVDYGGVSALGNDFSSFAVGVRHNF